MLGGEVEEDNQEGERACGKWEVRGRGEHEHVQDFIQEGDVEFPPPPLPQVF